MSDRCAGWMNVFIFGRYEGSAETLYFREWDTTLHDKATGINVSELMGTCTRANLTRESIVAAQHEGLLQAFTNKSIAAVGENGTSSMSVHDFANKKTVRSNGYRVRRVES